MTFSIKPGAQSADGDHRRVRHGDLPRDDALQAHDGGGGHDDRVDALLRHGAMRSAPEKLHLPTVRHRHREAGAKGDEAGRSGNHVLSQRHIRLRNFCRETILDHRPRALSGLFARLKEGDERSPPVRSVVGENAACAHEPGDMHVVAAGVGYPGRLTEPVLPSFAAGVGEASGLNDRQGVHVRPQKNCRAFAVAQDADDACPADALRDLEPAGGEPVRRDLRRAGLLHGKFRVGVDVLVDRLQFGEQRL